MGLKRNEFKDKNGLLKKRWKDKEVDILKRYYIERGTDWCQTLIPRFTKTQITSKANRLGLLRKNNLRFKVESCRNKSKFNNRTCAIGLKSLVCRRCLQEKDFNEKNFRLRGRADKEGNEQLDTICKDCHKIRLKELRSTLPRFLSNIYSSIKSRQRNLEFTKEYLYELWDKQKGRCALTGIRMTHKTDNSRVYTNISVDRINSKKNYNKDNIQLVCFWANIAKQDLEMKEFVKFCNKVRNHNYDGECEELW